VMKGCMGRLLNGVREHVIAGCCEMPLVLQGSCGTWLDMV